MGGVFENGLSGWLSRRGFFAHVAPVDVPLSRHEYHTVFAVAERAEWTIMQSMLKSVRIAEFLVATGRQHMPNDPWDFDYIRAADGFVARCLRSGFLNCLEASWRSRKNNLAECRLG